MNTLTYEITLLLLFCVIGFIVKLFIGQGTSSDGSYGTASAAIWGYGLVSISVLSLIFISFSLADPIIKNEGAFKIVKTLIKACLPSLLMFIILVWLITLNATYYKQINEGKVANEYSQFSTMSSIMVIFQLFVLFKFLISDFKLFTGGPETKEDLNQALKSPMASIS